MKLHVCRCALLKLKLSLSKNEMERERFAKLKSEHVELVTRERQTTSDRAHLATTYPDE